jgi:ribosomal protection tetracycline resistance protein
VEHVNLGILAHVDAGKTTLTERLLFAAGIIDEPGSVDDGSTQTDYLALERQRGITIKSAVVSFVVDDVTVNLIDTPGHPDFIAEVERVLEVLDGAVLVLSAVEGVQAQTRVLLRTLRRLRIPTLLFVNKLDRVGAARTGRVLREIATKLTPAVIAMGSARDPGTRGAGFSPYGAGDERFRARLAELLADHDDALLAAWVDDPAAVGYRRLRRALAAQVGRGLVHPVYFGSAITGAGVDSLTAGVTELLPAAGGDPGGPVSGTVFKVERGPAGEKLAYVRMFSGTVRVRDRVRLDRDREAKVTAITVFERGAAVTRASVAAGQIGKLWGLGEVRIGDTLGTRATAAGGRHFAPPTLETVVVPRHAADRGALHLALTQLAEQDPLINLRQDELRHETLVSLYGEVQKEVIHATLAGDFGIEVDFSETTTICIERPVGVGVAVELLHKDPNPFLATVGLRVEPAPSGSGVRFRVEAELGAMPLAFFRAVEDTVRETLRQGLHGWEVTDIAVVMTHAGYLGKHGLGHQPFNKSISSTGEDFRNLTPLVLMDALRRAGTLVHEPVHRLQLEIPADTLGLVAAMLGQLGAVPQSSTVHGESARVAGEVPAARVHDLEQRLPALTRGEGMVESAFDHWRPVSGTPPARPRTDRNPLDRREYLQQLRRRVSSPRRLGTMDPEEPS